MATTAIRAPVRSRRTNAIKAENERLLELSSAILEADDEDIDVSKLKNRLRHKKKTRSFNGWIQRNLMVNYYEISVNAPY